MNNVIIVDTREKGHKKILEYFDSVGQKYIISKLDAGDYMIFDKPQNIIDKKDTLRELAGNLCKTTEHQRINREIARAKEMGCTRFIFLIQDNSIKSAEDIKNWSSPYTKVKGSTLLEIMKTMSRRYGVEFIIVPKKQMGAAIIKLLNS